MHRRKFYRMGGVQTLYSSIKDAQDKNKIADCYVEKLVEYGL